MKKFILYICLFIFSYCQKKEINISLKYFNEEKDGIKAFITPLIVTDSIGFFSGIPTDITTWKIYTLKKSKIFNEYNLNVFSGFKEDSNYMIIDKDFDNDFSNNDRIIFKNINKLKRSEIPFHSEIIEKDNVIINFDNIYSHLKIYPFPNYYTSTSDSINNKLQIVVQSVGVYKGTLTSFKSNYNFFLKQNIGNKENEILIEKDEGINEDMTYKVGDKIIIGDGIYKISKFNRKEEEIKLIKLSNDDNIGLHNGLMIKNYNLNFLNYKNSNIEELLHKKDFLIIDFWGTWCVPCVEIMPDLKSFLKENRNVQALGVVLDKDRETAVNFIKNNNIKYPNHFIGYKNLEPNKDNIITEHRVTNYPYYILIDKKRRIIKRGSGKKTFSDIKKIIESTK